MLFNLYLGLLLGSFTAVIRIIAGTWMYGKLPWKSFRIVLIEWVFLVLFISGLLIAAEGFKLKAGSFAELIFLAIFYMLFFGLDFIVSPFAFSKITDQDDQARAVESWLRAYTPRQFKVFISPQPLMNAFAIGFVPFTKSIILGKNLVENLSEEHTKAIVLHELGHLEKRHLLKLYPVYILIGSLYAYTEPFVAHGELWPKVGYAALFGLVLYTIPTLIMRRMEIEADCFAAGHIGKATYIEALKAFDVVSEGKLSQPSSFTHPSLKVRIKHVDRLP